MSLRSFATLSALAGLFLLPVVDQAAEIDAKMRAQDSRLETPVTLHERRIYLSELLTKLQAQTKIGIAIDDRLAISGVQVSMHCDSMPVGKLLNSLWSLFSSQEAEWTWKRTKESEGYRYEFAPTALVKGGKSPLNSYVNRMLDDYMTEIYALAAMTPAERKRNVDRLARAMHRNDTKYAEQLVDWEPFWKQISLFTMALPESARAQVVHGDLNVHIPVRDLSASAQKLYAEVWNDMKGEGTINGKPVVYVQPDELRFNTTWKDRYSQDLLPNVAVDLGKAGITTVFGVGAFDADVRAYVKNQWMMPGDAANDPAAQKIVPEEKIVDPATVVDTGGIVYRDRKGNPIKPAIKSARL